MTSTLVFASRRAGGKRAYLSGQSAEDAVRLHYLRRGLEILHGRWRGKGGEIDLILRDGSEFIFCEVKRAEHAEAAFERLRPGQVQRIHAAASEYLAQTPNGQLSDVRFDLAAVDATGKVTVFENALGHF